MENVNYLSHPDEPVVSGRQHRLTAMMLDATDRNRLKEQVFARSRTETGYHRETEHFSLKKWLYKTFAGHAPAH